MYRFFFERKIVFAQAVSMSGYTYKPRYEHTCGHTITQ